VVLPAAAVLLNIIGCGMFEGMAKPILALINLSFFCNFLAMLLELCGVAATVNGEGGDYAFTSK
jgi:hypothetical protein